MADQGPDGRFVDGNRAAWTHGTRSERPVLRELLSEEERAVWDSAPVPPGMDGVLETVVRTWWVMQYRVEAWRQRREGKRRREASPADMERFMALMERPARVFLKALEVQVRLVEANASAGRDDAIRHYLAQMTPEQLGQLGDGTQDVPVGLEIGRLALGEGAH